MTGIKKHDTVRLALHSDQSDGKDIMLHLAPMRPLRDKYEKVRGKERRRRLLLVQKTFLASATFTKGGLNRNPNEPGEYSYDLNVSWLLPTSST